MVRFLKKKISLTFIAIVLVVYCLINYKYIYSSGKYEDAHLHEDEVVNHVAENNNKRIVDVIVNKNNNNNNNNNNVVINVVDTDNKGKKRLLAYDAGGFGGVQRGVTTCRDGTEVEITDDASRLVDSDFSYYHMQVPPKGKHNKAHYSMVFTLESEPHSYGGESWDNADFRMWYNLDLSFPEPATYFDVKVHLADLLSPPVIEFEKKTDEAPIAWIVSNCNAFNGREKYMKRFMSLVKVDSYGGCLKNKFTHTADRMRGNIELFSHYKFVIAIENSNCQDYITEKLVHAVASGSIPIVAGKDGKPDYLKFLPKHSYINLYDFKSPEEVADHIKTVSKNKTLYESYFPFKRHTYSKEYLNKLTLQELIELSKKIFNPTEVFLNELVAKEKSENKICKIARYITTTDIETINKEITARKRKRPSTGEACLPNGNLESDFPHDATVDKKLELPVNGSDVSSSSSLNKTSVVV